MNQETFNLSIRKFLKQFGVTAQHEIERAVERAIADGTLAGHETLPIHATLVVGGIVPGHRVEGEISLG